MMARFLVLLVLIGCRSGGPETSKGEWLWSGEFNSDCSSYSSDGHYVREPKSKLCFLQIGCKGTQSFSLTHVPCTPEVEAEIGR